jgi:hypothetical protein
MICDINQIDVILKSLKQADIPLTDVNTLNLNVIWIYSDRINWSTSWLLTWKSGCYSIIYNTRSQY